MKKHFFIGILALLLACSFSFNQTSNVQAKTYKKYTISANTKPAYNYKKDKNYNNSTKQYLLLKSYLDKIEKSGGGTLVLRKGTYTISNTLYIPSNTTIQLDNGVTIRKGTTTGKAKLKPSNTLFEIVPAKTATSKKKTVKKYGGSRNVSIIGKGTAVIDMRKADRKQAIVMAHTNNVMISNIQFKNNNRASFIHINGTTKTKITSNKFLNATAKTQFPALQMNSAIKHKNAYNPRWVSLDRTKNNDVTIANNVFQNQYIGMRTYAYNKTSLQQNINVTKNTFTNMRAASLYKTGWTKPKITSSAYAITPNTKPAYNYAADKNYNNSTKHYLLLKSYLAMLEKGGGGTLVLKKGIYTVSNTLYIPSNTTIQLNNGAAIRKGMTTGKAKFKPSNTLFEVVPAATATSKTKTATKYAGSQNVSIIGKGTAIIDMMKADKKQGIVVAHTNNVTISGIQFKNNNRASFIHLIGTAKTTIQKNTFLNATAQTKYAAIQMESAINNSNVYKLRWISKDKTKNNQITIANNIFQNQYTALKTVAYDKDNLQTNVSVTKNSFANMKNTTLYMLGWTKTKIIGNTFNDRVGKAAVTIQARVVNYPTITSNKFISSKKMLNFYNYSPSLQLSSKPIESVMSVANKKDLLSNTMEGVSDAVITLPKGNYGWTGNTIKLVDKNETNQKVYTFDKNTVSLNRSYMFRPSYTPKTRDYYVLRSIMEQLEKQNGGTLVIKKGDYSLTNVLYIPSNVTIELEDGVILRKAQDTDAATMPMSNAIFHTVAPSKSTVNGAVSGYEGSKNIKIYSKGRATIDLQYKLESFAIIMAHTTNVTYENIDFKNMNSGHFIELDASRNVVIKNCTFIGSIASLNNIKEAINIDTPDLFTAGFSSKWSSFDRTPVDNVRIEKSHFENLDRAIGTHKYSGTGIIKGIFYKSMMHKNVKIVDNEFINTRNDAIRVMNWENPIIENNYFNRIGYKDDGELDVKKRGILISGVKHPVIKNNTFENARRPIQIIAWKNPDPGEEYDEIHTTLTAEEIADLQTNVGKNLDEYFIRHSDVLGVYTNPEKYPIKNETAPGEETSPPEEGEEPEVEEPEDVTDEVTPPVEPITEEQEPIDEEDLMKEFVE